MSQVIDKIDDKCHKNIFSFMNVIRWLNDIGIKSKSPNIINYLTGDRRPRGDSVFAHKKLKTSHWWLRTSGLLQTRARNSKKAQKPLRISKSKQKAPKSSKQLQNYQETYKNLPEYRQKLAKIIQNLA